VIGEGDTYPARDPIPSVLTPVGVRATPVLTDESSSDAEQHQEPAHLPPRLEISTILWRSLCAFSVRSTAK